jgi:hypothetical protein
MANCAECGLVIYPHWKFCPKCESPINQDKNLNSAMFNLTDSVIDGDITINQSTNVQTKALKCHQCNARGHIVLRQCESRISNTCLKEICSSCHNDNPICICCENQRIENQRRKEIENQRIKNERIKKKEQDDLAEAIENQRKRKQARIQRAENKRIEAEKVKRKRTNQLITVIYLSVWAASNPIYMLGGGYDNDTTFLTIAIFIFFLLWIPLGLIYVIFRWFRYFKKNVN